MMTRGLCSSVTWGLCACVAAVCLLHSNAWAQHRDIFLASGPDGQLAAISASSVFEVTLAPPIIDDQDVAHYPSGNPGFAALNELFLPDGFGPLPANSDLSFSILSFPLDGLPSANLWYWDGVDQGEDGDYLADVAFTPFDPDSTSAFRVFRGPVQMQFLTSEIADGSDADLEGFTLAQTSQGGGLHIHPGYEVFGPAATPPDEGLYLVSLVMHLENLEDSEPVYFVLRTSEVDSAAGLAAQMWVDDRTSVELPTPGDFDLNGDVDGADYLLWQRGESENPLSNQDLVDWQSNYSFSSSLATAKPIAIPEPATASLLLGTLGLLHLIRRRPSTSVCTNTA